MPGVPRGIASRGAFPALPVESKAFDVVGLGENSVDTVAVLRGFPQPDSKQLLLDVSTLVGGQVATAMVAAARLGCRARYVGVVGRDEAGRRVRDTLGREGVTCDLVVRPGIATRGAIVLVDRRTGGRTVLEHRDPAIALRPRELRPRTIASGRVLLVDARDPAVSAAAARYARATGVPVVLDVEQPAPGVERLLRVVDVIVCSGAFLTSWTGERVAGRALASLVAESGAGVAIATLGERGSIAWVGGRVLRTPGFRVKAVDTTGAGDAFRGGLIARWLAAGGPADPAAVLEYANAVAALNCLGVGAQAGLPTRARVRALVTRVRRGQSK